MFLQKVEITTEEEDVLSKILAKGSTEEPMSEEQKGNIDANCANADNPIQIEQPEIPHEENGPLETILNESVSDLQQTEMESGTIKAEEGNEKDKPDGQQEKVEETTTQVEPSPSSIPEQV